VPSPTLDATKQQLRHYVYRRRWRVRLLLLHASFALPPPMKLRGRTVNMRVRVCVSISRISQKVVD